MAEPSKLSVNIEGSQQEDNLDDKLETMGKNNPMFEMGKVTPSTKQSSPSGIIDHSSFSPVKSELTHGGSGLFGFGEVESSNSTIPMECQITLLCLDYLRSLRRGGFGNDERQIEYLSSKENLDAGWLSVAIYALSRAFLDPDLFSPCFLENLNREVPKGNIMLPSLEVINEEICSNNPFEDDHRSNIHRFFHLNGLASGVSAGGPISLTELTVTGLSSVGGRSRFEAEKEMISSPLFEQFVSAVQSKGFFSLEENEDEEVYEERFRKVVAKFRQKLALKAEAAVEGYWMGSDPSLNDWTRFRINVKKEDAEPSTTSDRFMNFYNKDTETPKSPKRSNEIDLEEAENFKNQGNIYMQNREFELAVEAYTTALRINPAGRASHVYFCNRAAALLSLKKYSDAILDAERSLALKPDYAKAHSRLGLAYYIQTDYNSAISAYTQALKYEPNNKTCKNYLEKAQYRLSVMQKKLNTSRVNFSPTPEDVFTEEQQQEVVSFASGDEQQLKNRLIKERGADKLKNEGNTYMSRKEYNQAVECYTSALRLSPNGPNSHIFYSNRAAALCYLELYKEAEKDSLASLALKPDYGKAHARLGLSRFFMGDYQKAVEAYENALNYDPNNKASESYLSKAKNKLEIQRKKLLEEKDEI